MTGTLFLRFGDFHGEKLLFTPGYVIIYYHAHQVRLFSQQVRRKMLMNIISVYLVFPDEAVSILSNFVYVYASLDTFWFVRLIYIHRFGVGQESWDLLLKQIMI